MNDFLQNSQPRVIAGALITVVLLVSTILVMYLLWPEVKQFRKLSESYQMLQSAAGSSSGLQQQLQQTQQQVRDLSYQLHGDMAGLPDNQMESDIIGRLQKISWQADVELASVIPGKGKKVQMFQETLFDVNVNARYFDFFNWLRTINEELGYVVVKKFEIIPQQNQGEKDPKLNITLTLVSYRMVQNG